MSLYSVPGDWFDSVSSAGQMYGYDDGDYDDDDEVEPDSSAPARGFDGAVREIREIATKLAAREDWTNAHRLRTLARRLEFSRGEFVEMTLDAFRPHRPPAPAGEQSPTGNCRQCGAPLPLPTMRRGRPRTLCLTCSPPRNRGR